MTAHILSNTLPGWKRNFGHEQVRGQSVKWRWGEAVKQSEERHNTHRGLSPATRSSCLRPSGKVKVRIWHYQYFLWSPHYYSLVLYWHFVVRKLIQIMHNLSVFWHIVAHNICNLTDFFQGNIMLHKNTLLFVNCFVNCLYEYSPASLSFIITLFFSPL